MMAKLTVHIPNRNEKRATQRLRLATSRLRTFIWNEKKSMEAIKGFSFISEISPTGVGLYLDHAIAVGTSVRLAFETQDATSFRGQVMWCGRFSFGQKFIGKEALTHRLGIRVLFGSEAERQRFLAYTSELKDRVLFLENKAA